MKIILNKCKPNQASTRSKPNLKTRLVTTQSTTLFKRLNERVLC